MAVGIFFVCQTALGMLGNSALLCGFVIADISGIRAKPKDLIIQHLTWANFIVLCRGIPQTIATLSQTYYLDNVSCKLALYFHRVARGMSIAATSLLSVFQAITISPNNSKWGQLKVRAPKTIGPSLVLCWALQLLRYGSIPVYTTDIWGGRNVSGIKDYGYCAVMNPGRLIDTIFVILFSFYDVIFLGLMILASGYMVFILLKHKQRVQHIHRFLSPRASPETRATQSILTLVSSFVFFHVTSIVFTSYLSVFEGTSRWLLHTSVAMTACFPTVCPFLLIRQHTSVFRVCCSCSHRTSHCACVVREL
ncbi:vomeronasal type-1 receptor 4-like [Peromyscus leucopus]|uniref:vomeronasal type-1 receptor 4-like n=1 Tax=Peromyscus leucopus TaxID=10041 RepID=UPI0010A113DA|nr:vomeronasal type-1 receptor 4-like [Peromyscus leucopus]